MKRVLVSWSSGKDSAWMLTRLMQQSDCETAGLFTATREGAGSVPMHEVRPELLAAQAEAVGLPLQRIPLPSPCSNAEYERIMRTFCEKAVADGITHIAFGDLFLDEIRAYRERNLAGTGLTPLFPLWGCDTRELAHDMVNGGLKARVTSVMLDRLDASFAGCEYNESFLADLPDGIDPCGENGEFHTFVSNAPCFRSPVAIKSGGVITRDGMAVQDLFLADNS